MPQMSLTAELLEACIKLQMRELRRNPQQTVRDFKSYSIVNLPDGVADG